jgi:hypothetical protein
MVERTSLLPSGKREASKSFNALAPGLEIFFPNPEVKQIAFSAIQKN